MAPTAAVQDTGVSSDGGGSGGKVQAQKATSKKRDMTQVQDGASKPKQSAKQTEKINASLAGELCLPDTSPVLKGGTSKPPSSGSSKKVGKKRKATQSTDKITNKKKATNDAEENVSKKKRSSIEKATEGYWKEAKEHGNLQEPVYQSTNMTTTKQVAKADDNLLPPALKKNKNGTTDFGRIRPCMCTTPSVCRELMWRYACLKEGKFIHYLTVPKASCPETPVGKHVNAYRQAVHRHLGYVTDGDTHTRIQRTLKGPGVTDAAKIHKIPKEERIAAVHFHPDVIPYILEDQSSLGRKKLNKYRIPIELGKEVGLKDEDKCPTDDTNGVSSFYSLPNYSLEDAAADCAKAEEEYKQNFKALQVENESMQSELTADPSKFLVQIHDLKQQNAKLLSEKKDMEERLKRQMVAHAAIEKKTVRLQKGLEKVARRLDKWESTQKVGRTPNCQAKDIYREATGLDLSEEGFYTVEPAGTEIYSKGKGGKRWSDPRMDRAVEAKQQDPTLSSEDALRIGGYEFPEIGKREIGKSEKDIMDSDNVSIKQRKNNLLRRLRQKKQSAEKKQRKSSGGVASNAALDGGLSKTSDVATMANELEEPNVAAEPLEEPDAAEPLEEPALPDFAAEV